MNRNDLQKLAKIRLKEARILLINRNYDGAYYLCGYVIECALKSCIAKKTNKYDFPSKEIANKSYNHDFITLVNVSGLSLALNNEKENNANFSAKWNLVKNWSEVSRYETHNRQEAWDLYNSIVNRNNGVLKWIKKYW